MKKTVLRTCFLTQSLSLISLLILITFSKINAQDLQLAIRNNHKIYLPEGKGPFRTIVAVPGCSGVSFNGPETDAGIPDDEGDRLFRRHYHRMAIRLQEEGFLVIIIDYLNAENVPNTCGWEIHPDKVGEYINEAITFVQTIPICDPSKITVIGWSHGGEGLLSWLSNLKSEPMGVKSAIAVYPGCSSSKIWSTKLPVLMLLGEEDDIAIPNICDSLYHQLPDQTNTRMISYPNSRHGFDLTEGPTKLEVGNGLTIGRNSEEGTKAWKEIILFLNQR